MMDQDGDFRGDGRPWPWNIKHNILSVPIVRLKTKEQQVKELFDMFKLPTVDYTKGYQSQPKPRAELTGGSSTCSGLQAVNEIRKWYRRGIV